jgi:plastocyanin
VNRAVLASALAFSAAVHLVLAPAHLEEMPLVGALFIPAGMAAAAAAVAVVVRPHDSRVAWGSAVLLAGLLVAYVPFVTVAVPFAPETPEPVESVALATKAVELVGLVAALSLARRRTTGASWGPAAAAALLSAAAGLVLPGAAEAARQPQSVVMEMNSFAPHDVTAVAGDEVIWRNGDSRTHTVTADDGSFDSGPLAPGASFSLSLPLGPHTYHCRIHRFMRGVVNVYALALSGPAHAPVGTSARFRGAAPEGVTSVALESLAPGGSWTPIELVSPAPDGSFSLSVPAERATLRARAGAATSPVLELRVSPRVVATRSGGTIEVTTEPAQPGARVALERYDLLRFDWFRVARARLSAGSHATFAYRPRGREYLRVKLTRPVGGYATATSPPLRAGG